MSDLKLTITKPGLILLSILMGLLVVFYVVNAKADVGFDNCTELKAAAHRSSIPKGDKLYNPAMDRDHDNVSCE